MRVEVEPDVLVPALEPQREPALALAAITPAQGDTDQLRRKVVAEPLGMLADDAGAGGADLLLEFAEHGDPGILVRVDAALGELPAAGRALRVGQVGAAGDEDAAFAVEQH